jgi:hypothetical protein
MDAARKSGRAGAYLSYHWEHRRYSLPALYAGWAYYVCLLYWRETMSGNDGKECPMQELLLRRKIHRVRQHMREYGSPHKYDKRGTKKQNYE